MVVIVIEKLVVVLEVVVEVAVVVVLVELVVVFFSIGGVKILYGRLKKVHTPRCVELSAIKNTHHGI